MKKPLFIHIPKAGGSSIQRIFQAYNKNLTGCLHRVVASYSKKERESCFVFTFTRNPFDRLLSAHKYLTGAFGNAGDTEFGKTLSSDFQQFVKKQLSDNINWLHFRPMTFWLNDDLDYIGRFENFQQGFDTVCDKIGIPRQRIPHRNKTDHKHYTEYYDNETRQIVAERYAKDIEYFGYKFGE